ncbi:hypothetical protein [Breoghania sp.]|uniref:hypothetical protein n=1 Tax=Breoghania sp. TaxID=2065378 RepID=UPI002AABD9DE|nr:hypothetical protein [Breoghania sp.]
MTAEAPSAVGKRPRVDVDILSRARILFEENAEISQAAICRKFGMTQSTLAYHAKREGWIRAAGAAATRRVDAKARRARLVARLYRAFERQVCELEERIGAKLAASDDEREATFDERDVKLLSTLAQTLARLVTLDVAEEGALPLAGKAGDADTAMGNDGETDLDEFRRSLAQRLEMLAQGTDRGAAGEP